MKLSEIELLGMPSVGLLGTYAPLPLNEEEEIPAAEVLIEQHGQPTEGHGKFYNDETI
jgi:hypothetical protein